MEPVLLVEIPEAEPVVGEHRRRLDRAAALGIPPHVSPLYPFVPSDRINAEVLDAVAAVAGQINAFDYRFPATGWFGEEVLFLDPDDPAPFVRLTAGLFEVFPDYPPEGGAYSEIVPQLTKARGGTERLARIDADVRSQLPIDGRAGELTLMTADDAGRSSRAATWRLDTGLCGGSTPPSALDPPHSRGFTRPAGQPVTQKSRR